MQITLPEVTTPRKLVSAMPAMPVLSPLNVGLVNQAPRAENEPRSARQLRDLRDERAKFFKSAAEKLGVLTVEFLSFERVNPGAGREISPFTSVHFQVRKIEILLQETSALAAPGKGGDERKTGRILRSCVLKFKELAGTLDKASRASANAVSMSCFNHGETLIHYLAQLREVLQDWTDTAGKLAEATECLYLQREARTMPLMSSLEKKKFQEKVADTRDNLNCLVAKMNLAIVNGGKEFDDARITDVPRNIIPAVAELLGVAGRPIETDVDLRAIWVATSKAKKVLSACHDRLVDLREMACWSEEGDDQLRMLGNLLNAVLGQLEKLEMDCAHCLARADPSKRRSAKEVSERSRLPVTPRLGATHRRSTSDQHDARGVPGLIDVSERDRQVLKSPRDRGVPGLERRPARQHLVLPGSRSVAAAKSDDVPDVKPGQETGASPKHMPAKTLERENTGAAPGRMVELALTRSGGIYARMGYLPLPSWALSTDRHGQRTRNSREGSPGKVARLELAHEMALLKAMLAGAGESASGLMVGDDDLPGLSALRTSLRLANERLTEALEHLGRRHIEDLQWMAVRLRGALHEVGKVRAACSELMAGIQQDVRSSPAGGKRDGEILRWVEISMADALAASASLQGRAGSLIEVAARTGAAKKKSAKSRSTDKTSRKPGEIAGAPVKLSPPRKPVLPLRSLSPKSPPGASGSEATRFPSSFGNVRENNDVAPYQDSLMDEKEYRLFLRREPDTPISSLDSSSGSGVEEKGMAAEKEATTEEMRI